MNFKEAVKPLTELLTSYNFSIAESRDNVIQYSSENATISVAYSLLEHSLVIFVGHDTNALTEVTAKVINEVFKKDAYNLKETLTVENFLSFLKSSGKGILAGDTEVLTALNEYSLQAAGNYTQEIMNRQNFAQADIAWEQKDYVSFIRCIDQIPRDLLQPSYKKKYSIAFDSVNK